MIELHRELRAARGHRTQVVDVTEHVRQRHEGVDRDRVAAGVLTLRPGRAGTSGRR